jgi:hypothetical protein
MKSEKYLSDLYGSYINKNLSKRNFEGKIFQYLLDNPDRFHLFNGNQDSWGDFLSWLYPRLARSVDVYRDMGSSFDTYIKSLIYSAAREYRSRESEHNMTEYVCWQARAEEMVVSESEPEYAESRKRVSIPTDINPRQILFLLLKSYFFVSDEFVKKVAQTIGMEVQTLQRLIDELRKRRSDKEAEILDLRERLHCQHYRCITYQKRMINTQHGTEYHERMKFRFERARKRFYKMKKRLGGMRMSASNRMIAEVLGIPRGTIDSSLSALKNRLIFNGKKE